MFFFFISFTSPRKYEPRTQLPCGCLSLVVSLGTHAICCSPQKFLEVRN